MSQRITQITPFLAAAGPENCLFIIPLQPLRRIFGLTYSRKRDASYAVPAMIDMAVYETHGSTKLTLRSTLPGFGLAQYTEAQINTLLAKGEILVFVSSGAYQTAMEVALWAAKQPARATKADALDFTPAPAYGTVMSAADFHEACNTGCLTEDDGSGHWAKLNAAGVVQMSSLDAYQSQPGWGTHVVWFNK